MKSLTVVEETVMLAVYRLKEEAYSVTIHQKILDMTGKDMIIGTLFNVLKQLFRKGYIDKKKGKAVHEKGGKSIMFYSISEEGFKALDQTRKMHNKIWENIAEDFTKGNLH
jgi:DNA-binding PadR family transcriptional regulator